MIVPSGISGVGPSGSTFRELITHVYRTEETR
jgi:hypothetical protein